MLFKLFRIKGGFCRLLLNNLRWYSFLLFLFFLLAFNFLFLLDWFLLLFFFFRFYIFNLNLRWNSFNLSFILGRRRKSSSKNDLAFILSEYVNLVPLCSLVLLGHIFEYPGVIEL